MTIDEKLKHIQEAAMTEARAEGNNITETHRKALETLYQKHVDENTVQFETRVKSECVRNKQLLNQTAAKAQADLKRKLGKKQILFKDQLFAEVRSLLKNFMKTEEYIDLLQHYVNDSASYANGQPLTIYLTAADQDKKAVLEERTGLSLTISNDDFIGGIRTAIPSRNILIDHSFKGKFESEYEKFQFEGGNTIE